MQKILSYMRKAIRAYNMIEDGDKIAVCLSGGKGMAMPCARIDQPVAEVP